MAIILALDSSGDVFTAAVNRGGNDKPVLHRSSSDNSNGAHSTRVALPLINALLQEQHITLADCDAIAFAAGPGKFSALRLVCAIARTLAYAHHKPLLAVASFAALAQANYGDRAQIVKCALPAHRGHVYFSICERSDAGWQVKKAVLRTTERALPGAAIGDACGAGYRDYPHLLGNAVYCNQADYSDSAAVWQLAQTLLKNNQLSDPLSCEPFYLRRKVAATIRERQCTQTLSKN